MTDHAARTDDDTVEHGLTEDLLGPKDPDVAETAPPPAAGPEWSDLPDDEDYLAPAARRSRLTTALLVALIFLIGVLVGTVLSKTLSPDPAPQIVYVLNDAGSPAPAPAASTPG